MAAELHSDSTSSSPATLRALLLEDSDVDAELVVSHLRKAGLACDILRATNRYEFTTLLSERRPDVVLADYSLPDFDGLTALDLVRRTHADLPFIFVSGVVGEEFAINALRRGATDYVMKRGLNRLPSAVDRAIAEAREREERQRAERALRLSETNTQLAVEAAGLGKLEIDPKTGELQWDARCKMFFDLPPGAQVTHELFLSRCYVEDRARIDAALRAAMRTDGPGNVAEEIRVLRPNATQERWLSISGRSFFEHGECTRFIGVMVDITERKLVESALHEMNRTLKQRVADEREHLWHLSQDLLAVMDPSGILIEVNPAWNTVLGYRSEDVVGRHFGHFTHEEDVQLTQQALLRAGRDKLRPFKARICCRDAGYRWISWSAAPGHGCLYVVGRDITEDQLAAAKLAEAQNALRQAQKMEAVGQLTGGVAHDFNNLLQVVVGNLETLQRKLPENYERLRRAADQAMAGARRAVTLTQRLLAFSRRQPLDPRPVAINKLVAGMSELLQRTLGELIEIDTRMDCALWGVAIDENQLESALLNLAVNARDAMPEGGKLVIETRNVSLEEEAGEVIEHGLAPGDYVMLAVTDTGCGMPADVVARAFEPFFTTKSVGQGTGLGLSQVYGFVKQSGGHVKLRSAPGEGTSLQILLPRLSGMIVSELEESVPDGEHGVAKETVLVVEDDVDVRAYTVELVRELGYYVHEARDGHSALKLLQSAPPGSIDLLFSDVVLPGGINGQQLALRAVQMHPGLKVLFATGYARDVIVHDGRLDPGVQLINKPFAYADLAAKIRSVLESEQPRAGVAAAPASWAH
jgi:PAS domain S-box-containing protein